MLVMFIPLWRHGGGRRTQISFVLLAKKLIWILSRATLKQSWIEAKTGIKSCVVKTCAIVHFYDKSIKWEWKKNRFYDAQYPQHSCLMTFSRKNARTKWSREDERRLSWCRVLLFQKPKKFPQWLFEMNWYALIFLFLPETYQNSIEKYSNILMLITALVISRARERGSMFGDNGYSEFFPLQSIKKFQWICYRRQSCF